MPQRARADAAWMSGQVRRRDEVEQALLERQVVLWQLVAFVRLEAVRESCAVDLFVASSVTRALESGGENLHRDAGPPSLSHRG